MQHFIVTRPEPEAGRLVQRLAALGHMGIAAPLTQFEPLTSPRPAGRFTGLLLTSPRALAALPPEELAAIAHLPALAVGEATAEAAAEAGVRITLVGDGGVETLLRTLGEQRAAAEAGQAAPLPAPSMATPSMAAPSVPTQSLPVQPLPTLPPGAIRLLHPGGTERDPLPGGAHPGLDVVRWDVYRMAPLPPPPQLGSVLMQDAAFTVLLFSPRAARLFAGWIRQLIGEGALLPGSVRGLRAACLAPSVAQTWEVALRAAGLAAAPALTAAQPSEAALLDSLNRARAA